MAKITTAFECKICKSPLQFPDNLSIVDFMILVLQFYKDHEICEQQLVDEKTDQKKQKIKKIKKKDKK